MKCNTCGKMNCMAHGGEVKRDRPSSSEGQRGWVHDKDHNKGIHRETGGGRSYAGSLNERGHRERAKEAHGRNLEESRAMPKPKLKGLAHGGFAEDAEPLDVDMDLPGDADSDIDNELNDMVAQEFLDAIEKKDKAGILDSIKALIMNCGG